MKIKIIISIFILGGIMSCSEEFTNLAPISQRNVENFYKTANDMNVAVNAIYSTLQEDGCYNESYWVMQELRSDNTFWDGTGLARIVAVVDEFTEDAANEVILRAWNASYLGVSRANIVLSRIPDVQMDAALKDQYIGEALFLRSLYYYHLAVGFGNIPLVLTETQSVDEGRSHVQVQAGTVYTQLISDLAEAESKLPVSHSGGDLGRATKGAAATLLAKVLLTNGDKPGAETVLRRIISSYGYSLVTDYANIWGVENEHNSESIFEVEFEGGLGGEGNRFTNDFSEPLFTSVSGSRNWPTDDMIAAYEAGDARAAVSFDMDDEDQWVIKYGTENPFAEGDAPNNWIVLRYADVLLMLAEAVGEGSEGYGLINQVRSRAGLGPIDGNTPGSYDDKLLRERRVELAFENHRWADLLRFGRTDLAGPSARPLFLIPQRELDLNPDFVQN